MQHVLRIAKRTLQSIIVTTVLLTLAFTTALSLLLKALFN